MIQLCKICGEPSDSYIYFNPFHERSCSECLEWLGSVLEYRRIKFLKSCGGNIYLAALIDQIDDSRKELFN